MLDYHAKVAAIMQNVRESLKPVVEKEVLHYGILEFMQQQKYLQHIVFMGGTALRLCHGAKRFSEDLDFAGGKNFNPASFRDMAMGLQEHISRTYALPVRVTPPKTAALDPHNHETRSGISVDKWLVSVETHPGRKDIPRQIVKIELANVPAYDVEYRKTLANYQGVPIGTNILIPVESKNEILADKLLSLPVAAYPRYRDIWDIVWLSEQGAQINPPLLIQKIHDYGLSQKHYLEKNRQKITMLHDMIQNGTFEREMARFLNNEDFHNASDPQYRSYLHARVKDHLLAVQKHL